MTETTTTTTTDPWYGAIAHSELGSNDPNATTDFLNTVFGMRFDTMTGPNGMDYHMAYEEGRPSCGVRQVMTPNEPGPSQTPFVNVENIDETIAKAKENGATVMLPKMAVPGQGWMTWLQIPGGNTIAAWQQDENAA